MVTLHRNRVVHMDIKPDNVIFSPTFKKVVFIDYGFSEIIEEEVGFKTLTAFQGSPQFISREMMTLFGKGDSIKDYVDLYFNDLVGAQ